MAFFTCAVYAVSVCTFAPINEQFQEFSVKRAHFTLILFSNGFEYDLNVLWAIH